jgi:hypothetical protein
MARVFLSLAALAAITPSLSAVVVLFPLEGEVIILPDEEVAFTGNNGTVTYLPGNITEITGDFANLTTRILDPYDDDLESLPAGDASLSIESGDPVYDAELYAKFWDVTIQGQTIRKGWFKVYRTVYGGEEVFLSGNVAPLTLVDDVENISYDDDLLGTYAGDADIPTLQVHDSEHMQSLVEFLGGTSNADVTFTLAVDENAERWAVVFDRVEAAFDQIMDLSAEGYAEETISDAAYGDIIDDSDYAESEYRQTSDEGTHGNNCRTTMLNLEGDIGAWVLTSDITDPELAGVLEDYCRTIADACELHANFDTPTTWGTSVY